MNGIPNCAWKAKDVIPMHKHLFLDYLSGEWVLGALVEYYNLEKVKRATGTFKLEGTLTVRGAHSAIDGMLQKIAAEPALRQQLRQWTSAQPASDRATAEVAELHEAKWDEIMPAVPKPRPQPAVAA